ncbi:MAG: putative lipid II flippase FtsW [Chloroflexota bacterium]|nr:putative lipid II flippase FtsW [Chloroflexota bacterium]
MKLGLSRTTTYDLPLVAVVLVLLFLGLAMVYSASGITALDLNDDPSTFLAQQSAWAVLGVAAMLVASRVDYRLLRFVAVPLLLLAVVLLGAVLIPGVGVSAGGATRWLRFGGSFGLQPAEFAKLALIVYLATWLGAKREHVGSWRVTVPFVLITMLIAGLVIAEPDLGTTIVIVMVALGMYFAAGARVMMFAALGLCTAVGVAALAVVNPERLERLTTFMNPWAHPQDAGFQTIQMLYALGLGGPFGEGLGAGKEKFGYLPHPYTDSIFAVLGDELGLAGTLVIVLLFLVLAFRGVRIALRAEDSTGALLATGVTMWLCFQAWVNMAVVASLVPMTGITLPFISYGGSSLCVGLIAVGILLNVGRARTTKRTSVSRASRRGRDGRTREPAPRGRGSAPRDGSGRQVPLHRWSSRPRG